MAKAKNTTQAPDGSEGTNENQAADEAAKAAAEAAAREAEAAEAAAAAEAEAARVAAEQAAAKEAARAAQVEAERLAAEAAAAAEAEEGAFTVSAVQLVRPHGFIDGSGTHRYWHTDQVVTDPSDIELLVTRQADVLVLED